MAPVSYVLGSKKSNAAYWSSGSSFIRCKSYSSLLTRFLGVLRAPNPLNFDTHTPRQQVPQVS